MILTLLYHAVGFETIWKGSLSKGSLCPVHAGNFAHDEFAGKTG